jgi:hypothetical protein
MASFKKLINIAGLAVLLIASFVYYLTAERTGSLWDCGEFILGAYKLQVVHPPGAGLFVLIGRMFTWVASLISDNPSNIAFAVNLMSGLCTAIAAMCIAWVTMLLGKMALVGRDSEPSNGQNIALTIGGIAAGLSSAFITSVWFSAVEGEVYAMSTMFTALTIWSAIKWYHLPNNATSDRWIIMSLFFAGLSVGVHLLSLLAFPALALFYYYKKFDYKSLKGLILSMIGGIGLLIFVQKIVIVGIPTIWATFDKFCVNSLGLPFHSGIVPTILLIGFSSYFLLKYAHKTGSQLMQNLVLAASLIVVAYSTIGIVVVRANADTPVNMNTPSDAMRLIPYLNREQYGERPLLKGPTYLAQPIGVKKEDRYGRVGNEYKVTDEKFDYEWKPSDMILFPRIGHQDKADLHQMYKERMTGRAEGKPTASYNFKYFWNHQLGHMYFRYFMWNFSGRQNFDQGTDLWNVKDGNWISGIKGYDDKRLYNSDLAPDELMKSPARNKYYMIPFLLGLFGMVFHFSKSKKDFIATLLLFIITGIGIIIYSNQPPIEPRERDYVLVGSFITFCIWIGFGAIGIGEILTSLKINNIASGAIGGSVAMIVPFLLFSQNYDDHDRSHHLGSRDYAANFLNSVDKDAIIFTYGDNDTYPLWYAQEVENIRRDVRVVNLSLIQVDWYINKLRSKVNESPAIKMSIPKAGYDGKNLNQIFFTETPSPTRVNLLTAWQQASNEALKGNSYPNLNNKNFYIPFDRTKTKSGLFNLDSLNVVDSIPVNFGPSVKYLTKDDIAILDLVASNIQDRPVYFSVTCKNDKLQGLNDYMQLEGLGLRVVPVKTPSDRQFSIYGSGRVELNKHYDRVMKDFKWGNFDKVPSHVDKSYLAAVQSMKLVMLRGAYAYLAAKDDKRAAEMCNKYFASFPHMNFPYDAGVMPFINVLTQAKDFESAKKNIKVLAQEVKEYASFYQSLSREELRSFGQDAQMWMQTASDLKASASKVEDAAFEAEINKIIGDSDKKLAEVMGKMNIQ